MGQPARGTPDYIIDAMVTLTRDIQNGVGNIEYFRGKDPSAQHAWMKEVKRLGRVMGCLVDDLEIAEQLEKKHAKEAPITWTCYTERIDLKNNAEYRDYWDHIVSTLGNADEDSREDEKEQ